jgi:hypothetical protein
VRDFKKPGAAQPPEKEKGKGNREPSGSTPRNGRVGTIVCPLLKGQGAEGKWRGGKPQPEVGARMGHGQIGGRAIPTCGFPTVHVSTSAVSPPPSEV